MLHIKHKTIRGPTEICDVILINVQLIIEQRETEVFYSFCSLQFSCGDKVWGSMCHCK